MRQRSSPQRGAFNLRVVVALLLCSSGASLAMLTFAVPAAPGGTITAATRRAQASPVIVTEFSDFQCPYCKQSSSVVEQVREAYGERVKVVFKQMPLRMHQHAFKAAQASVCAQQQGKFWGYHDRLFASNDLSPEALNRIAAEVGLKQNAFKQCMASDASRAVVEKDIAEAGRLGVRGTPTFFVNGTPLRGAANFATLKQEIEAMLGPPQQITRTVGQPSSVWQALPKSAVGNTLALMQGRALAQAANERRQAALASTTTTDGVTLSPASINFGYQLVGTTGPQMVETVTNSGNAPVVITDISVSGRDRGDFPMSYNFSLPVTLAPSSSIAINFSFAPALPWRAGTRSARLEISERNNSQYVPLTGIGATCLGPVPACSSGCPDSDGDGLNDAWEIAGGIDINNDGRIDAVNDVLLPGADPNRPDIYVHYDWMDYGKLEYPCIGDADCPQFGNSQFGTATCTGPAIPGSARSCAQSCNNDADCQALGEAHGSDHCVVNVCLHTHDPEALSPGALNAVAARFASHGINLHIERGQALPHSHVVSFRLLTDMTDQCEGGSVASGTAGLGEYAESYFDLKSNYFDLKKRYAYHYIIFSHYSGCDTLSHCANDGHTGHCPLAPTGCATVAYGQSGSSEINGNNVIVSLGSFINDGEAFLTTPAPGGAPLGQFIIGGTFMHELGHNLGLHHGGGASSTPDPNSCTPPDCEDLCTVPPGPNYKPNYLTVMNYRYQLNGIQSAAAPGGFVPTATRLDYSTQVLPSVPVSDGVPGVLDELGLDETVPNGLTSGNADLFKFTDAQCVTHSAWPTHGPVDWDGNGIIGDNSAVMADLNPQENPDFMCSPPDEKHRGHVDWGPALGQSIFRYKFQCTPFFANGLGVAPAGSLSANELTAQMAKEAHVLYPTRPVNIEITPGHPDKSISPGKTGEFSVALLGSADLDVRKIELTSLRFHGAAPMHTQLRDIHGDGRLDLVIVFNMADVRLDPNTKKARLTGWLKSSQAFIGEDRITIVR